MIVNEVDEVEDVEEVVVVLEIDQDSTVEIDTKTEDPLVDHEDAHDHHQ